MANPLMHDSVWRNKQKYEEAETHYQEFLAGTAKADSSGKAAKGGSGGAMGDSSQVMTRVQSLEKENRDLKKVVEDMKSLVQRLENRVSKLEGGSSTPSTQAPVPKKSAPAPAEDEEDEDDIDLFGSDEEDEEADRIRQERLAAYAAKKAKKPAIIAKSSLILDVKPWDDETDMEKMDQEVRKITADGLLWGQSKLVPIGYGIRKLQISCVIEDDKISTDFLEEEITGIEDLVQSMDIAAFNKI